jgi:hypothetical protein
MGKMFKEGQNAYFNMYKWKLIHFILPCKELLKQWRIVNNSDYLAIIPTVSKLSGHPVAKY